MTLVRGDWFYILLVAIDAFFMARPYLYAIQQDNYRVRMVFSSRRLRFAYLFDVCAVLLFTAIWVICYFFSTRAFWGFLIVLFFYIAELALYFMEDLPARKKPLRYTKRAVRCLVFVTIFATSVMTAAMATANGRLNNAYMRHLVLLMYPLVYPILFMAGAAIINIFERLNNLRYMRHTHNKLTSDERLLRIGITGSYGKTSVKNFLYTMLAEKYNVLATPASYNTPMGISKAIGDLDNTYDVFIAEMGARRAGDIRTLMKMVEPQCTILTGVNSQHLESFGSQENILREKLRALELDEGGIAVVNYALKDEVEKFFERRRRPRIVYAGLDEGADIWADEISVSDEGSVFFLNIDGDRYELHTRLLGRHNVENILLAAAMAYAIGVEVPFILHAIEQLEPIPHRLQLIEGNGLRIIDDSFNSNPDGAAMALDTLSLFEHRRVVITPGLVELGSRESEENYKLGIKLSETADLVMLVGAKRTDPIRRGLIDGGFGGEIHIYDSLKDAEDDFKNRLRLNDVLLILNDLPDIYDEKL